MSSSADAAPTAEPLKKTFTICESAERVAAAGLTVAPTADARAMANGVSLVAGNGDVRGVGAGITIGRSVRRGYASYGAVEAPMLTPFHNPTGPTGGPNMMQAMGASNTIGRAARERNAVAIVPALTLDFINMEASRSSRTANVDSKVVFSLRAASGATTMGRGNSGPGYNVRRAHGARCHLERYLR